MSRKLFVSKPRKTIYIMGGFGNVLFQLNFANRLRNAGFSVVINSFFLQKSIVTSSFLNFQDHGSYEDIMKLDLLRGFETTSHVSWSIVFGWLSKLTGIQVFGAKYYGHETPVIENISAKSMFGYFHYNNSICEDFVLKLKAELVKYKRLPASFYLSEILRCIGGGIVVHVRGGDFKQDPIFDLSSSYYARALRGCKYCYVVTNDREYASKLLSDISMRFEILDTKCALDDFSILAFCSRKVLANSTFSWWAAEVGGDSLKITQRDPFFKHISWSPFSGVKRYSSEGYLVPGYSKLDYPPTLEYKKR